MSEVEVLNQFLEKYGSGYDNELLEIIQRDFSNEERKKVDLIASIRSYMNLDSSKEDRYRGFANFLKYDFDLNGNILEVGAGFFPTLAIYVDDYQHELGKGSITAYDPKLVVNNYGNIKLVPDTFDDSIEVSAYDLIYGFCPCESTKTIINTANIAEKPFVIGLCGCTHFEWYTPFISYDFWVNHLLAFAEDTKHDDGIITTAYIEDKCEYPYPIIIKSFK